MTAPLRVLVVSDTSPLHPTSGGERVLWEQASRLAAAGHAVRVLSRAPGDDGIAPVERRGVRIRHFPADRRSPVRFARTSIREAARATTAELGEAAADVLHLYQPFSAYGSLRAAGRRLPSLYTFLSPAPLEYRARRGMTGHHRSGAAGALAVALLWAIERACLRRATAVQVLSDASAALLRQLYGFPRSRVVKLAAGADTDVFHPAPDRAAVRRALGLPEHAPVLFTLRNLETRMGLDTLVRAVAGLRRDVPDVLLLLGGQGPIRDALEVLVAELGLGAHVRFLGFVPESRLPLYYQAADLFVLPTRELEGFGLVTVEALASGTPVIGTRVGATPEILEPLDPALVFRGVTPEAMAADLHRWLLALRDPAGADRLRWACRVHAEAHYSWKRAVARLEETLAQLVAGARTR